MPKNRLILQHIEKSANRIEYSYYIEGDWEKAFRQENRYFIEYGRDICWCPDSVAVIPFLGNFLPVSWVFDAEIVIPKIDGDFLRSIDEIKRGYQVMYPALEFRGSLCCGQVCENKIAQGTNRSLLFFSGGVDAVSSMLSVLGDTPTLMTLWGSDLYLNDEKGWRSVQESVKQTAERFSLPYTFVKTSFRSVLNEPFLTETIAKPQHENWWHGFQHGLAIITHAAPFAFLENIRQIYLASTDSAKFKEMYICASHPMIDNQARFCGCRTLHEGFEKSRSDKIRQICSFSARTGIPLPLRVCWVTRTGSNCCVCEKCMRTLYAILAEGYRPEDFGFSLTPELYQKHLQMLQNGEIRIPEIFWKDIIQKLANQPQLQANYPAAAWLVQKYPQFTSGNPFYPTPVCKPVSKSHTAAKPEKQKLVLFKSPLNIESREKAFQSVGMNTGNQVFAAALNKLLHPDVISWQQYQDGIYDLSPAQAVITTDLIWIHPKSDFDYLYDRLQKIQKPFIPISIGLQSSRFDPDFRLNHSSLKTLAAMQERAVLGVRGEYTASILEKHGIRNLRVIGCPSMYWFQNPNFQFESKNSPIQHALCNFRTFYGTLSRAERHFLTYCANRNLPMIEQTSFPLASESVNDPACYQYLKKWLDRKTRIYFDTDSWRESLRGYDFMLGARFHGNVIALWEGIPALFLLTDSRTQELTEFFHLPSLRMEEFDRTQPIEFYFEKADYTEFNRNYRRLYENFCEFLRENRLPSP